MHTRGLTDRTGAQGRVLRADEFEQARTTFVAAMGDYKDQLTRLLSDLRKDLTRDPHEAAEELRRKVGYWGGVVGGRG